MIAMLSTRVQHCFIGLLGHVQFAHSDTSSYSAARSINVKPLTSWLKAKHDIKCALLTFFNKMIFNKK